MRALIISKPHILVFGILSSLVVFFGQKNLTFPFYSTTSGSSSSSILPPKLPTSNLVLAGNLKKESNLENNKTSAAVDITAPSLVDLCRNNEYVTLPPIVIAETANGDFKNTGSTATLRIRTPNSIANNSGAGDKGFEVLLAPVNVTINPGSTEVSLNTTTITPQIRFDGTGSNSYYYLDFQIDITGEAEINAITIEGIKVRAKRGDGVSLTDQSFNWKDGPFTTTGGVFTGIDGTTVFATVSALAQTDEISLTGLTNVDICKNGTFTASDKFDVASGTGTARWFSDATLLNQVAQGDVVTVGNGTEVNGTNSAIGVNPTSAGVLTYYVVRDNNGCLSTAKTVTVTIQDAPTITLFSNSFNNEACKDGSPSITFTATGASNYSFEIDKGSGFVAATDPTDGSIDAVAGTFTINTSLPAGSYSVQATSNVGGCMATSAPRTFEINPLPNVTLNAGSTTIVTGDSTPLTISPAGGTFSGLGVKQTKPGVYIFDSKDLQEGLSYDVTYSYTNGTGCTSSAMVTIDVNAKQPLVQDLSDKALPINVCVTQGATAAKVNTSRVQLLPPTCPPGHTRTTTYEVTSSPNTPGLVTVTNANTGRFTFNPSVLNNIPSLRNIQIRVRAIHNCLGPSPSTQVSATQTYPINFHPEFQLAITGFEPVYCETISNDTNIDFVLKNRKNTINGKVQFYLNGNPVLDTDPRLNNTTHTFNPYQLAKGEHKIRFEYTDVCTDFSPEITIKVIDPPALTFADIGGANTYCNEAGNKLQLAPTINGSSPTPLQAQNGFFTIKDGANETKLNNGVNEIDLSTLISGRTYQVFYTYTAGTCVEKTGEKDLVMVDKPALVIEGITDGESYCTNSADVTLTAKVTAPLGMQTTVALGTLQDYIEMKSVATGIITRLAANQLQFSAFAPGVYEATFFHQETGSYQCSSSVTISITINKPEVASFNGVSNNDQFCVAKGIVPLTPLADNQSSLNKSNGTFRIWQNSSAFEKIISANTSEFNTNDLNGVGDYNITFSYKDGNNCEDTSDIVNFSLVPVPDNVQVTVIKEFNQNVVKYNSVANGGTVWSWMFDDGTTASTQNHLRKLSSADNTKEQEYTFEVRNSQNCAITHTKNFILNFGFTQQCQGGTTQFSDLSSSTSDTFTSWLWNFDDGSTSTMQHASHLYTSAGSYMVSLTVTTADGFASYTLRRRVDIFPGFTVTPTNPYFQDFSGGSSGWLTHGTVDSTGTKVDRTSWKLQVPAGFGHIPTNKGTAWVTDNQNNTARRDSNANYNSNEQSYVESPCFDITALNRPMVSFSYWSDIDNGSDGVVLLYTIDDGKTWARVGNIDQGLNWYNTRPILGKPGNDFTKSNDDAQGWSGNTQTNTKSWKVARFGLDAVLAQMTGLKTKLVRFRIAFGSNSDNTPNVEFDGFAFDDFQISNRNRLVLSEYFINHGVANASTLDKRGHDFAATKSEAINIHYHTNFPGADKINEKSEKDVSARSFHYGIRAIPRIVVDGLARDTLLGTWAETRYSTQTLITAPFTVNLGQPTASNGILDVNATITAIQAIDRKVVMQIAVIDTLTDIGGTIYRNSVMKMLPDGAGTFHAQPWAIGSQQTLNYTWDYGALGLDPGRFKVVVFIEDYDTKEIYQAGVSQVQVNRQGTDSNEGNKVTGIVDDLQKDNVKVFPNPTSRYLHIALQGNKGLSKETSWEIISANGQVVKRGIWSRGYKQLKLNIIDLATGVYLIRVYNDQVTFQRRFEKQ